jgi:hypothetical protein
MGVISLSIIFVYFVILLTFSLTSKEKALPMKQDKCFDDWCASVIDVSKTTTDNATTYIVTLQISSHARGRAQEPDNPFIYVVDEQGTIYPESETVKSTYEKQYGKQRPISSRIDAQSSYQTNMVFLLPTRRKGSLVITEGGFPTPLIIGDEGSLLHRKSITPLDKN